MVIGTFSFNTASSIVFGAGSAARLGEIAAERLGRRVLLVTDRGLVAAGLVAPAVASLEQAGCTVAVYDKVIADPPESVVLEAVGSGNKLAADAVIGLGGGSSLDVAKLVALLLKSGERLVDIYGVGQVRGKRLPLLLSPTTAGTGSEVTPISIVTTGAHEKKGVVSPVLLPDIALLDPELTYGLPAPVTAATGVDAMVHAIESFTSTSANRNPISAALATEALRLLAANIAAAVHRGDHEARGRMLLGSMLAGQAFANSPVAAVHALAYPIGGHYGIPHGLSNALVLPAVLEFNLPEAESAYAELAPHAFPDLAQEPPASRAAAFIRRLAALSSELGLPPRLRDVGIPAGAVPMLAREAMKQTRLLVNNPRPLEEADAAAIYEASW
jgi:alcohol dehydrogenase class IV